MKIKKIGIFFVALILLAGSIAYIVGIKQKKTPDEVVKEISPVIGSIETFISSTGTILPKNRLEIKPPVNGRIEKILVKEGDEVKTGDILALMSSTERAALIDAARAKGEDALKYWEETYKPIPLLAPIDGEVIVETTQPGQTVTTSDPIVVLSDRLIVRAQVDETDIGKISLNKKAIITIDAYPDTKINSTVEHIYYESKTVNNVTIYEVDLIPEEIPKLLDALKTYHMAVGIRPLSQQTPHRALGNRIFIWVAERLSGHKIPDLTSGFRAIHKEYFMEFIHLLPNRYSSSTTLTLAMLKAGLFVGFVPISRVKFRMSGKSGIAPLRDGFRIVGLIFRAIMLFNPQIFFLPVSAVIFLTGLSLGAFQLLHLGGIRGITIIFVLTGILIFMFGLLADQIANIRLGAQKPETQN